MMAGYLPDRDLRPGETMELETQCKGHFAIVRCVYCPGCFPIGERAYMGERVITCPWCKTRFMLTGYGVKLVK